MTLINDGRDEAALEFLLSRRSRPHKTLTTPVPSREELAPLLTAAARTPDHGKLEPWRFIVMERAAMQRVTGMIAACGARLGVEAEKIAKAEAQYDGAHLAVVVVATPTPSEKVPEIEQLYSAGAACLGLLNAALASGWGANWLSGWASHDAQFVAEAFDAAAGEKVAGIIHIGTQTSVPPERPRPDVNAKTTWVSE